MKSTLSYYSKRKWTLKSRQCLQSGDKEQSVSVANELEAQLDI